MSFPCCPPGIFLGRGDHSKLFLLFEFCCGTGTPPLCLKVMVVAYSILVSAPGPLVFELVRTWLGLDLGSFGTKGLGPGLDNNVLFIISLALLIMIIF